MVKKKGLFLKHYTKKYAGRSSNIRYDYPRTVFLWTIKERLNLEPDSLTAHFAWRSAATALADTGISVTNLKQAGRWKSDAVAEGTLRTQQRRRMSK
eukprot:15346374-Ditylum_brightwellii.AAC.1